LFCRQIAAIGGSYADREIAIVEKYWTTNSLAISLKVSLAITGKGTTVFTAYDGETGSSALLARTHRNQNMSRGEVTWSKV
jgi:hypothetical protein